MYNGIQDCDEGALNQISSLLSAQTRARTVFNFWEPLHYLWKGYGFQTWETSPVYAIRSWAYILIHLWPAKLTAFLLGPEKVRRPLLLQADVPF